jgi:hypothetical protein
MVKQEEKKVEIEEDKKDTGKKPIVKEKTSKAVEKKPKEKKMTAKEREELLIENFVGLQHAMTNMSIKFGALSDNISKLLQVFEEAAKGFVSGGKTNDKDMLNKIDSLLDQNKTIAKGLILMEGKLRGRNEAPQPIHNNVEIPRVRPRPLPNL